MLKGLHPFETCRWNIRTSGFKLECHPLRMLSRKSPWSLHSTPRRISFFLNKSLMNSRETLDSTWNVQSLIFKKFYSSGSQLCCQMNSPAGEACEGWEFQKIPLVQAHEERVNSAFPSFCRKVWKPGSGLQVWNWGVTLLAWHTVHASHILAGWLKTRKMRFLLSRTWSGGSSLGRLYRVSET